MLNSLAEFLFPIEALPLFFSFLRDNVPVGSINLDRISVLKL